MNDVEDRLTELYERRSSDVGTPTRPVAPVLRRARRRQVGVVAASVIGVACLVAVPLLALSPSEDDAPTERPATTVEFPDAPPGFDVGILPYASIAYPDGWYLLDTSSTVDGSGTPVSGPILQLSNVDPDVAHSPRCFVDDTWLGDTAVLLSVFVMPPDDMFVEDAGTWPAELAPFPGNMYPSCNEQHEQATWTGANGLVYSATLGWGPDASDGDIDAVRRAFESLRVPSTPDAWIDGMSGYRGSARAVLGTTRFEDDVLTFVAYLELDTTLWVGIQSNGPWVTATAPYTGSDPDPTIEAGLSIIGEEAALLDGIISPEVARVEVRTDDGGVAPMEILPIPASLGTNDRFVWALVAGAGDRATVVGYDADGEPIGNPNFAVRPSREVASGTEAGEPWTLEVTQDNTGWGWNFTYASGSGGGGGVDLGDKVFGSSSGGGASWSAEDGWSDLPHELVGVVTAEAERVEYHLIDGGVIPADVVDIPAEAFGGGARMYVAFVPRDTLIDAGDLVAFASDGQELGRQYHDASPVTLFPKALEQPADVLEAMRALQLAGGVAQQYFFEHDTFEGFAPETASTISDDVVYNGADTAVVGEVSIRVDGERGVVLATRTPGGDVYSACFQDGPTFALQGRNDTTDVNGCGNGWLD